MLRIIISAISLFVMMNVQAGHQLLAQNTNNYPSTPTTTDTPNLITSPQPTSTTITTTPSVTDTTTPVPVTTTPPVTTTTTTTGVIMTPSMMFSCMGTNPNWTLDMTKNSFTYTSPSEGSVLMKNVTPMGPMGPMQGAVQVYSTTTSDNKPITIVIRKNEVGCSADSSGSSKFDAILVFPDKVAAGCCMPKPGL